MYIQRNKYTSRIETKDVVEGEPIEHKMERILSNKEPITDGAPEIFTDKKDGVGAEYNIRTDRWELATEAMDLKLKNEQAKAGAKAEKREKEKEAKIVKLEPKKESNGGTESTNGTTDS